jgi:hypothetical protein
LRPAGPAVRGHRRDDPPDVTEGDCELMLGENDELLLPVLAVEEVPVFPSSPVDPVLATVDRPEVEVLAALFPGCSCATTTAMPTVAPVVAKRAALVSVRRRARVWSRLAPALRSSWADISSRTSARGTALWDHVDIGPDAKPAVGLL